MLGFDVEAGVHDDEGEGAIPRTSEICPADFEEIVLAAIALAR